MRETLKIVRVGLLILAVALILLIAARGLHARTMSDQDALQEAQRRWGQQAIVWKVLKVGNKSYEYYVGVQESRYQKPIGSAAASFNAAFASVPPDTSVPQGYNSVMVGGGISAMLPKPSISGDIFKVEARMTDNLRANTRAYMALLDIRKACLSFDPIFASYDLKLQNNN